MGKGSSDLPEDGALAEQDLLQDDMIVMGTDGLWDNIFEDQVAELAVGKTDMDRLAKNIAQEAGLAAKGYVHRLVKHHKGEYSYGKGNHINGLEGFWGYLKRRLAAKGGIRKERLPLYLAEYVWRYNHRNDSIQIQKILIMKQLERLLI